MAATNYTPIQLYFSTTASAVPLAANLAQGELAINITDGKLYYEDNAGVVQVIATKGAGTIGGSTTQIQYNNAGALAGNAAMTFNSGTSTTTLTTLNLTNALGATYGGTAQSAYAQGDVLYASATNTLSKLSIGANTYILTSTGSVPQWSAPSSIIVQTATNLAGGLAGSVPYQSALDTTTFLAIGAANRVMTSTGSAPQWVTSLTGLTGVSSSSITNTSLTSGRVVVSTTAGLQADDADLTFDGTTLSAGGFSTVGLSTLVKTVKIGDSSFNGVAVFAAATPAKLYIGTGTVTDTTSAIGATNAVGAISSLAITPIAATNTSVTYTNAATLYIAGAPSAGTNITLTNPYALYVNGGASYFGGAVDFAVTPSYSGGTANGVMYLNGSKQITTGTALGFDGTNLAIGIAPTAGVQLYVYAPASTNAEVRIAVPTATQATYISFVNTTVTKIGTENSVGGALASGSSAYATVLSNNGGNSVQIGTNNVIRATVDLNGGFITTPIANGHAVFNEDGVDADFRVESDTNAYMLFVDAGDGKVTIGGSTPGTNDTLTVFRFGNSAANNAQITIDANANSGTGQSALRLLAGSGTTNRAARVDFLNGVNSTTTPRWTLLNDYQQNGTNDFNIISGGSDQRMVLYSGSAVFNETGNDVDFRVESDTNTHALFVDAGNSRVGINQSSPAFNLDVNTNAASDTTPSMRVGDGSRSFYIQPNLGTASFYNAAVGWSAYVDSVANKIVLPAGRNTLGGAVAAAEYDGSLIFYAYNSGSTAAGDTASSNVERLRIGSGTELVVNNEGNDYDFRVESDTNAHALFVDAGSNTVGILSDTIDTTHGTRAVQIGSATGINTVLTISAGADNTNDRYATLVLRNTGNGGATNRLIYGVNDTTPSSGNIFNIMYENPSTGVATTQAKFTSTEVVLNDDSLDQDFRVESDTNTHALFVDAGNSRVGVNNSNPSVPLDVTGIVRIGYQLNQSSPVQNTWYDIIASMVDNSAYQVALFAIKGSNEQFAIYQSLQVIGSLNSSTQTASYTVGSGSGLEYRILNNFPSPNSMQVRVTAASVSALRASVLQMGG